MHSMLNLSITFSFVDFKKINTDSATSNTVLQKQMPRKACKEYSNSPNENCRKESQLLFLGVKSYITQ